MNTTSQIVKDLDIILGALQKIKHQIKTDHGKAKFEEVFSAANYTKTYINSSSFDTADMLLTLIADNTTGLRFNRLSFNGNNSFSVIAHGNIRQLDEIKAQLSAEGWDIVKKEDYPSSMNRDYLFAKDKYRFYIHLYMSGDTCELVQVGTEVKEIPVYELKCK